jgi:hypothetical protein
MSCLHCLKIGLKVKVSDEIYLNEGMLLKAYLQRKFDRTKKTVSC